MPRHMAAREEPTVIITSSQHNCPFSQKATSIYLENPELNFPTMEET